MTDTVAKARPQAAKRAAKLDTAREAIRAFIADPEIDALRVRYQGYARGYDRTIWSKRHKKLFRVANAEHRARLAVADGTIKMLTTSALPEVPSKSFVFRVDRNARVDEDRRGIRQTKIVKAASVLEQISQAAEVPRGGRQGTWGDAHPAVAATKYNTLARQVLTPADTKGIQTVLVGLAVENGVSQRDFGFLVDRFGRRQPTSFGLLGKGAGVSRERVRQCVDNARDKLAEACGWPPDEIADLFQAAFDTPNDTPATPILPDLDKPRPWAAP